MIASKIAAPTPMSTFFQVFMNHPACRFPMPVSTMPVVPDCLWPLSWETGTARAATLALLSVTFLQRIKFPITGHDCLRFAFMSEGNLPAGYYSLSDRREVFQGRIARHYKPCI